MTLYVAFETASRLAETNHRILKVEKAKPAQNGIDSRRYVAVAHHDPSLPRLLGFLGSTSAWLHKRASISRLAH
jgi:hypothetical protein